VQSIHHGVVTGTIGLRQEITVTALSLKLHKQPFKDGARALCLMWMRG
jgi:hypothetical protein